MTERYDELETALDRVLAAARGHLAAVRAAEGQADDDAVWQAYVELNNASLAYDELLLEAFGEVTPWDVEAIDPAGADREEATGIAGPGREEPEDAHPQVISVRQRRDYRVPSVAALLRVASAARRAIVMPDAAEPVPAIESVGEAVLELMQAGDGALGSLDVPELEALDGVVVVAEVRDELDPAAYDDADVTGPFSLSDGDRLLDRLDEHAYLALDPEGEDVTPQR